MSKVALETAPQTRSSAYWIVGAGGLLAGEFLRLAEEHPALRLAGAVTRQGGGRLASLQPHLGRDLATVSLDDAALEISTELEAPQSRAVLVFAMPHGDSAPAWKELRERLGPAAGRLLVVDLSADYRLHRPEDYLRWYGVPHPDPAGLAEFVYGLPELEHAHVVGATRVAAPGCFATAMQLACVPAARAGLLDAERDWVLSAVTGSSGSGNQPKPGTHHPHRHGNMWAYSLDGHRHEGELLQALAPTGLAPALCFVPHSGPFVRGIHLTAALPLRAATPVEEVHAIYAQAFAGAPFVEVLAAEAPDLRRVVGSNRAALSVTVREKRVVVLLTLDNSIKGGAGQALQCLNLMLGLAETTGLPRAGLGVI